MIRTLYNKLLDWKTSPHRKPLILEGARQVGKTWLLKEFGKNEYSEVAYINCHNNPDVANLFADFNMDRVLRSIAAITGVTVRPETTLVILDEIQEAKNGLASLKYFNEQCPDIHIAVAGSLLGLAYRRGESFPVGKVDFMQLYPMTFGEFLSALGKTQLLDIIATHDWDTQEALQSTLIDLLRQYYFVGGMPEALLTYINTNDINAVRDVQRAILMAYDRDFAKHAADDVQRVRLVWNSIPSQLARENKKFVFGAVKKGARAAYFDKALQWLKDAALTYRVERCKKPEMPLSFYVEPDSFKIYLLDVGLLGAMAEIPAKQILVNDSIFTDYKGAFTENFVLQQLLATRHSNIYYFSKDNSTQEVDFLFQTDDDIIAVEVKAEVNVKSKSLSTFINVDNAGRGIKAVRFSMLPYKDQGWMKNYPLWSTTFPH
ncbi:MAG: ATP-binding protein [Muribaculaceae bacterium]|nr:ATP-binding protein [Muribaculaceae bacterium]